LKVLDELVFEFRGGVLIFCLKLRQHLGQGTGVLAFVEHLLSILQSKFGIQCRNLREQLLLEIVFGVKAWIASAGWLRWRSSRS
jgi:hypothetical protein